MTETRYKEVVGGCVLVALVGGADRLLYWGGLAVFTAAVLLFIGWLVGLVR